MPKGGKRTGAGRRKGTPNKHKTSFREGLRAYCALLGVDPHRYMAEMIADPEADKVLKLNAAKELAQYIEPKLKAMEHSGEIDHMVRVIEHRYGRSRKRD
jgi:hypothetical protein